MKFVVMQATAGAAAAAFVPGGSGSVTYWPDLESAKNCAAKIVSANKGQLDAHIYELKMSAVSPIPTVEWKEASK